MLNKGMDCSFLTTAAYSPGISRSAGTVDPLFFAYGFPVMDPGANYFKKKKAHHLFTTIFTYFKASPFVS